jgi:hypothetical protein
MTQINNARMSAFCDIIKSQAAELIDERANDMLKAWTESIEEATENEDKFPPLKIGIAATVDIEKAVVETAVSFTVKYKSKLSAPLPDPDQPEFPGIMTPGEKAASRFIKGVQKGMKKGESVTIATSNGKLATIHGTAE